MAQQLPAEQHTQISPRSLDDAGANPTYTNALSCRSTVLAFKQLKINSCHIYGFNVSP